MDTEMSAQWNVCRECRDTPAHKRMRIDTTAEHTSSSSALAAAPEDAVVTPDSESALPMSESVLEASAQTKTAESPAAA